MTEKTKFFRPQTRGEEEDLYGLNILTDGDRMGEVIPSLHAWMPPEAMRERVNYHEEVTKDLAQKKSKNRAQKKGQKRPSYPGVQSDQNHDTYLEAKAPREQMKTTQELLEEYGEDLIEANGKGPRRPTG
ncbi:MAG TPA: hypothetical protein GX016_06525 [Firmicutes bacterium]|jgi:hypothetical protein|nr:hypothetical protein [Bacillota bacterium]